MDVFVSMDIHEYPWISIHIHGCPWISMDYLLETMDIHGCTNTWISMDYPWISMDDAWMGRRVQLGGAPGSVKDHFEDDFGCDIFQVNPGSIWEYFGTILDNFWTICMVGNTTQQQTVFESSPEVSFINRLLWVVKERKA